MSDFHSFASSVKTRFDHMSKGELYVTIDGNAVWEKYLASFPEGTNPIYKERTEHDCSCCKHFVRNIGNVVSIVDGEVQTIWGGKISDPTYAVVAVELDEFVRQQVITGVFRTSETKYGAEKSTQLLPDFSIKKWDHFHATVNPRHVTREVGTIVGDLNTTFAVFKRGLDELSEDAFVDVIDLINQNALYRGAEFKGILQEFQRMQRVYKKLKTEQERAVYVWQNVNSAASRFRNTAIGTLIQDLTESGDLEGSVRSFESKVAPTNYKRPTALITPKMVKEAMAQITELGLEEALQRRFAKLSDVSVNNVLWVDGEVQSKMKGGIESLLMETAKKVTKINDKDVESIDIATFMEKVVPKAAGMELLVTNQLQSNFVSLTAPVHENSGDLFKWNNNFAWSYDGNITDSIKEKVKKAGGNVTNAKLRISLAWFNFDDLDIHVTTPRGHTICFYNKREDGGVLDVDMNAGSGHSRTPVENVSFISVQDGEYTVAVNQYRQRDTSDVGFVIEVESAGKIHQFTHGAVVRNHKVALTLTVKNGTVVDVKLATGIKGGSISQEKWGVNTETFVKVNTLMFSPNFWDDNKVGNKHWFFILDKCQNPDNIRGIYNEFLKSDLEKHRKVFEVLGDKTKCKFQDEQLSGIGMSSTKNESLTVRVTGAKLNKVYKVLFN